MFGQEMWVYEQQPLPVRLTAISLSMCFLTAIPNGNTLSLCASMTQQPLPRDPAEAVGENGGEGLADGGQGALHLPRAAAVSGVVDGGVMWGAVVDGGMQCPASHA